MSYYEQLQDLYRRYDKDSHMQPFTMYDLASWAYDNGLCQPQRSTIRESPRRRVLKGHASRLPRRFAWLPCPHEARRDL